MSMKDFLRRRPPITRLMLTFDSLEHRSTPSVGYVAPDADEVRYFDESSPDDDGVYVGDDDESIDAEDETAARGETDDESESTVGSLGIDDEKTEDEEFDDDENWDEEESFDEESRGKESEDDRWDDEEAFDEEESKIVAVVPHREFKAPTPHRDIKSIAILEPSREPAVVVPTEVPLDANVIATPITETPASVDALDQPRTLSPSVPPTFASNDDTSISTARTELIDASAPVDGSYLSATNTVPVDTAASVVVLTNNISTMTSFLGLDRSAGIGSDVGPVSATPTPQSPFEPKLSIDPPVVEEIAPPSVETETPTPPSDPFLAELFAEFNAIFDPTGFVDVAAALSQLDAVAESLTLQRPAVWIMTVAVALTAAELLRMHARRKLLLAIQANGILVLHGVEV